MRVRTWGILLCLAWLGIVPASAQEEPPKGCFCLSDEDGQVQRGCERKKFTGQFYWSAICRYALPDETIVTAPAVRVTDRWTVIGPDDPSCSPCDPTPKRTDDLPRQEDKAADSPP